MIRTTAAAGRAVVRTHYVGEMSDILPVLTHSAARKLNPKPTQQLWAHNTKITQNTHHCLVDVVHVDQLDVARHIVLAAEVQHLSFTKERRRKGWGTAASSRTLHSTRRKAQEWLPG